jgi:hypothetical protein
MFQLIFQFNFSKDLHVFSSHPLKYFQHAGFTTKQGSVRPNNSGSHYNPHVCSNSSKKTFSVERDNSYSSGISF